MDIVLQILFLIIVLASGIFFAKKIQKIRRNIFLGKKPELNGTVKDRLMVVLKVAIGQGKMGKKPVAAFLHVIVYIGFVLINIEVIEILSDGIFGTHRFLHQFLGGFYNIMIGFFEILAFAVLLACIIFLIRRNVLKIKRFLGVEMTSWPKTDANVILIVEVLLMSAFLLMNAADYQLQLKVSEHYILAGSFPISSLLFPLQGLSEHTLIFIERTCWWFHILGILAFLNYLPYSKHLHILLVFPNVYYSNLNNKGKFNNLKEVTDQVNLMMDPNADPYAAAPLDVVPVVFGAKDVESLPWTSILQAFTCTECGRCSDVCPANSTGKLLSPRKIMMDVRDRAEEVGKNIDTKGKEISDGKDLFSYITPEELWACTSCNACTDACPVNNDPLAIIIDLRRFLVMEKSQAPQELNTVFSNIENNGAPWAFPAADRFNWANED